MTLENYVKLEPGKEKVLRIKPDSFKIEARTIPDPRTKAQKTRNAAVMDVTEEDGAPVNKTFSTLSEKLATTLKAAAENKSLYYFRVGITQLGQGYVTEYGVRLF